ncbi:hypothetical protein [Actinomadura sp. NEAU-AAG7]|uniref:hypothetical protein n=1 Tax=Actinomadura sp. NEAU-AAG7 TaxID=2839640 RepID=UPI001BE4568B|nr:hypothetical protein [Actinomadura sp. NEAU-AAG7]MBT2212426.1 hypothetical protein [Actinomadura sp. NEAU-AAG7]
MTEATVQVLVNYSQFYFVDNELGGLPALPLEGANTAGIAQTVPGFGILYTGIEYGRCSITVVTEEGDPGCQESSWVDIVEVSFLSLSGTLHISEWGGGKAHDLPPLAAGPGTYRLRYCASGPSGDPMEPSDTFIMQFWPQPPAPSTVVKAGSPNTAARLRSRPPVTSEAATTLSEATGAARSTAHTAHSPARWDKPQLGPPVRRISSTNPVFDRFFGHPDRHEGPPDEQ